MKNKYYNHYKNVVTIPFTYLIKIKPLNCFYYGVRNCKGANPELLFVDYFTSSRIIHQLLSTYGKEAFEWEIRKTFKTKEQSERWEQKVLQKMNVDKRPDFINLDTKQRRFNNSETKCISNTNTGMCIRIKNSMEIPVGWVKGNINKPKQSPCKHTIWIYNPATNEQQMISKTTTLPHGWIQGRLPATVEQQRRSIRSNNMIWYNNGITTILLKKEQPIPEGFTRGRIKSENERANINAANNKRKGSKWITNGIINMHLLPNQVLPSGFWYGRSKAS